MLKLNVTDNGFITRQGGDNEFVRTMDSYLLSFDATQQFVGNDGTTSSFITSASGFRCGKILFFPNDSPTPTTAALFDFTHADTTHTILLLGAGMKENTGSAGYFYEDNFSRRITRIDVTGLEANGQQAAIAIETVPAILSPAYPTAAQIATAIWDEYVSRAQTMVTNFPATKANAILRS